MMSLVIPEYGFPKNIDDIQLVASNGSPANGIGPDYYRAGYWDVDKGGSKGTDGSVGHSFMAMFVKTSANSHSGRISDLAILIVNGNTLMPPIGYDKRVAALRMCEGTSKSTLAPCAGDIY